MAQTYTLDEAAAKLSLSVEEFKRRLRTEWTKVRSFRDGNTLRFRANEIDELARTIGLGSSEELQLADSDEIGLLEDSPTLAAPVPAVPPKKPAPVDDEPLKIDSDEVFLLSSDDEPKPKSGSKSGKLKGADSGVKLSDSKPKKPVPPPVVDDDESILSEDEFELPSGMSSSKLTGKSGQLSSIRLKSTESGALPKPESPKAKAPPPPPPAENDSSEFELSLDAESDDFELSVMPDSSEEVSLGEDPYATKKGSGQSGINLNRPADSGVSLEGKSSKNLAGKSGKNIKPPEPDSDDEIDFELSIDSPGASSKKLGGSSKKLQADSDSEFELSLEEPSDLSLDLESPADENKNSGGDIFETDFEIPALEDDSASEAISLDEADTDLESSEFDLAIDESGEVSEDESASEVVAIDEDDVQAKRKSLKRGSGEESEDVDFDEMEVETGSSASQALAGVNPEADEDGEEYEVSEASEDGTVRPAYAPPAEWGVLPAIILLPTILVLFVGSLMAYELLHSLWGYQQSTRPTTPLLTALADAFGMKPNTQ